MSEPTNYMGLSKLELRKQLKNVRNNLSEEEVRVKSVQISRRFVKSFDWSAINSIHTYLPIAENKEVNTWGLLEWIWKKYPGVTTSTSIYSASRAIQHAIINNKTEFEEDSLGIPIPISNFKLQSMKYDLIVVPVLGFDKQLNRIGYGRGVYDSFLTRQKRARKIGLAYNESLVAVVPSEPHDVQLDTIITETKLYN